MNNAIPVPKWLTSNAVYQICVRTFSHEGTIKAVTETLPELKELGFGIIYLCPVYKEDSSYDLTFWSPRQMASQTGNPKNPYRISDYYEIDEEYGTQEDLKHLIDTAHSLDIRVLLDLVYLHLGAGAGVFQEHPEFAKRNPDGTVVRNKYNFVALNYECNELREYLWRNMEFYMHLGVDGFRCDVGDKVPIDFWEEGKRRITDIKQDAVLINEGSDFKRLSVCFESSYLVQWHDIIHQILLKEKCADDIYTAENKLLENVPEGSLLLRDIDNHDTVTDWPQRVEEQFGHDAMELILVMNYLYRGIPMIFAGNELGDSACLSLFANRFFPGKYECTDRNIKTNDYSVRRQSVIKKLNEIRRNSLLIQNGECVLVETGNNNIFAFSRIFNGQKMLFVGNLSENTQVISVENNEKDLVLQSEKEIAADASGWEFPPFAYAVYMNQK